VTVNGGETRTIDSDVPPLPEAESAALGACYEDAHNHAMGVICGMVALNLKHDAGGGRLHDGG
jgi:hypothetical protein